MWVETQQSMRSPTDLLFAFCFPILLQSEHLSLHMVLIHFCWENSSICNSNQRLRECGEMGSFLLLCCDLYSDYSDFNSWLDCPTRAQWSVVRLEISCCFPLLWMWKIIHLIQDPGPKPGLAIPQGHPIFKLPEQTLLKFSSTLVFSCIYF